MFPEIRNFCILAHVDHGKSTLADRFLELTGTVSGTVDKPQFLDSNPISRERGITIKLAPVRMIHNNYIFNLIDTPGHVDFSYEVSRSLAACEGAILLADATSGIQAQTVSYFNKAKEQGLAIIPVVNKIDLPAGQPEQTALDMINAFGFREEEIIFISAKTGEGLDELFAAILAKIPPPQKTAEKPLRALVFDSFYDVHKGVVVAVRVIDGSILKARKFLFMASGAVCEPMGIGYFKPLPVPSQGIENGSVGYVATGLKDISLARVGDTIAEYQNLTPLPGYQQPQPMVYCGIYPVDQDDFPELEDSLDKLKLNDASLTFSPESSEALGKGIRVGFLGPLHAEVVVERLEREFNLELVTTAPNVEYRITQKGQQILIKNIAKMPEGYEKIEEPMVKATIMAPREFVGDILKLSVGHRGKLVTMEYLERQVKLIYEIPLSEIIIDFFSDLKSVSSGFASFDYEFFGFAPFAGARIDILVGGQKIDALSIISPKDAASIRGRDLAERLYRLIPKQMFEFSVQAAIGGKVISRMTKNAWRKDVTAKLYGGDQTRKDKLLKKQKKGKKRMKAVGQVYIPQEAFLAVLKR